MGTDTWEFSFGPSNIGLDVVGPNFFPCCGNRHQTLFLGPELSSSRNEVSLLYGEYRTQSLVYLDATILKQMIIRCPKCGHKGTCEVCINRKRKRMRTILYVI